MSPPPGNTPSGPGQYFRIWMALDRDTPVTLSDQKFPGRREIVRYAWDLTNPPHGPNPGGATILFMKGGPPTGPVRPGIPIFKNPWQLYFGFLNTGGLLDPSETLGVQMAFHYSNSNDPVPPPQPLTQVVDIQDLAFTQNVTNYWSPQSQVQAWMTPAYTFYEFPRGKGVQRYEYTFDIVGSGGVLDKFILDPQMSVGPP